MAMWQGVFGHDDIADAFRRSCAAGRLASTFLFVGPAGVGKRTFALRLAKTLLCAEVPAVASSLEEWGACGECESCRWCDAETHPDLLQVSKPSDKSFLPLELLIGSKERRMREGLCHDIGLKPFCGRRRVAILDDADALNLEGANCLLKTLEEPPPRSVLILVASSAASQLPTIRSRAQIMRFRPLNTATLTRLLVETGVAETEEQANRLAPLAGGSVQRAMTLADDETMSFRSALFARLANHPDDGVQLAATAWKFVEQAGPEAARRRERLRFLLSLSCEYLRCILRALAGAAMATDEELATAVREGLVGLWQDQERVQRALERTLQGLEHVGRNANPATLVASWSDDLAQAVLP